MKRRSLMVGALALAATLPLAPAALAQEVTLRLHQMLPMQATIPSKAIQPWIEKVEKESGGRIAVQHFPSMQLGGKPPALYGQAEDGVVDLVWTVLGYTPGRFPKTEAFELPFMTGDAEADSRAFHTYVTENAMDEFSTTKPLVFHVHGPGWIHSSKPIQSLDDMRGLKVRGPTRVINSMLTKLGAEPVGMPVPAVPSALQKGVIDATVIPWEVTLPLKVSELVENHSGFSTAPGLYTATFVMTMNKAAYEKLPDDLKKVIDDNSGPETAALFGAAMAAGDEEGRAKAEGSGNTIVELEADRAKWEEAAKAVTEEWVSEMDGKGLDGQKLVDAAKAAVEKASQ